MPFTHVIRDTYTHVIRDTYTHVIRDTRVMTQMRQTNECHSLSCICVTCHRLHVIQMSFKCHSLGAIPPSDEGHVYMCHE